MKVTLTIPESYKDIMVNQYQKWHKIVNENDPSDFVNLKTIEIFCQVNNVHLLPVNEVEEAIKHINRVFETMPKLVQRFKLNGVEFGLIPNFDEMSFGEYVDINSYIDNVTLSSILEVSISLKSSPLSPIIPAISVPCPIPVLASEPKNSTKTSFTSAILYSRRI